MKVYNLRCLEDHRFEGWFSSEDDFATQSSKRKIACPLCGNGDISKLPSAPRLNLSNAQQPSLPSLDQQQQQWLRVMREVIANTDDVGSQFAEEARRIHYREAPQRNIRGVVTADEHDALGDEGIDIQPFIAPDALKYPLQ